MRIKTHIKAGGIKVNHNQTVARGLKVQSHLRAGADPPEPDRHNNHNQTVLGLKVKSNIKAGGIRANHNQTAARKLVR